MGQWYFNPDHPDDKSRNSTPGQFFSSEAIPDSGSMRVREGIQNRLDAVAGDRRVLTRTGVVTGENFGCCRRVFPATVARAGKPPAARARPPGFSRGEVQLNSSDREVGTGRGAETPDCLPACSPFRGGQPTCP